MSTSDGSQDTPRDAPPESHAEDNDERVKDANPARGARFLMISAALVLVVAGLREIRPIALPFLVAIFLSVLSAPLLSWQLRHRVPKALAIVVTVLANIALLAGMILLVATSVGQLSDALPDYRQRLEVRAADGLDWLEERGIDTSQLAWLQDRGIDGVSGADGSHDAGDDALPPEEDEFGGFIGLDALFEVFTNMLRGIASVLTMSLLVVLMMIFLLAEAGKLPAKLEGALGWSREDLDRMAKAQREVQQYLVYKTLISAFTGVLVAGWVSILGVSFPLLWGLIAFLLNYIPNLGSIIAALPPMLLSIIDQGPGTALLVGLGYLVVNLTLGSFLEPHLMGRRLGISTLVVFLSLVFWGWMWGPLGMLLSVPLTMILRIALENTEDFRWLAQMIAARAPTARSAAPAVAITTPSGSEAPSHFPSAAPDGAPHARLDT
ncbi:MAG: AI-2E family transporter [Thermoanaerobaculia bacterium]|nr:AI-2E family transporter [Thermoanaerobaculia bacterium]